MSILYRSTFTARDTHPPASTTHGGGRSPEPEFRPDAAELAAWTAANVRARMAYYILPNAGVFANQSY